MSKKQRQKSKARKTASRPAPSGPNSPGLKHSTKESAPQSRKAMAQSIRKGRSRNSLSLILIGVVVVVVVFSGFYLLNNRQTVVNSLPDSITVEEAYQKYEAGTFVLDVRTQEEWDEYHAPNTTHIPLDQLENRLNELPKDEEIVVICRSGNRSQQGRDILLDNGFSAVTSVDGGLKAWSAAGYPIEGTRPQ